MRIHKSIRFISINCFLAIVFIVVTFVNLNHERGKSKNVIEHDIINYYAYLPACFYKHDLSLTFIDSGNFDKDERFWSNKTPEGKHVIKMSMGMAVSYLPFFALAHIYSHIFNYPTNGFSEPYHFAILFSSLIYYLFGLIFLNKILIRYVTPLTSIWILFCISFGTNAFFYLTLGGGLSHALNFAIISVFIYYTIKWHDEPSLRHASILGLLLGFIVLVRPIHLLLSIMFILYAPLNQKLNDKVKMLWKYKWQMVLSGLLAFLVFLPQMIYWKYTTGHYLFNSYVGERFYFLNPHILDGLFSFRKGWLIYTPLMIFSLVGIFFLKKYAREFKLAIPLFFLIYIYVTFSWWCWWYGGSFGQRPMVDIYPILAIPFAALFENVINKPKTKILINTTLGLFIILNLFQTMQAKYNILHYDSMTRENYFRIFFTTTKQADRDKYLRQPDYEKALRGEDEY